jgi:hypothetical protein
MEDRNMATMTARGDLVWSVGEADIYAGEPIEAAHERLFNVGCDTGGMATLGNTRRAIVLRHFDASPWVYRLCYDDGGLSLVERWLDPNKACVAGVSSACWRRA